MNIEKLTNQLQKAVSEAQSIAVGRDHIEVEPIHILLALLNQEGSSASSVLKKAGVQWAISSLSLQLPKPQ